MLNNKLNIALIGYGYWGPKLLRNLFKHPKINVECVCDLSLKQLKKAKKEYPDITTTQNFREVVGNKNIECAVVAVPTVEHFRIARELILAGKHVLVEKPMAQTLKEAQELVKLAKEKNVVLCVDHPFIFSKQVKGLKSLIKKGTLGQLFYYNSIRANLGLIDEEINVFTDLAPHDLAILDYLLDKQEPESVFVTGSSHILNTSPEDGKIFLRYKNGFVANIHLSWLSPVKTRQITIAGNKKMALYDDVALDSKLQIFNSKINILKLPQKNEIQIKYRQGKISTPKLKETEPLYEVIDSFVKAILDKKPALNDGLLGLRVVKTLEKINQSFISTNCGQNKVTARKPHQSSHFY